MTRRIPLLAALLLVGACATQPIPQIACRPEMSRPTEPPPQPRPFAPDITPLLDRTVAEPRWRQAAPAAYAYTLTVSCFCTHRGEYAVEVRDGRIVAARDAATGAATTADRLQHLVTVDALFARIREAEAAGRPVRAAYHGTAGFPQEARFGRLADDSGILYRIHDLRPL